MTPRWLRGMFGESDFQKEFRKVQAETTKFEAEEEARRREEKEKTQAELPRGEKKDLLAVPHGEWHITMENMEIHMVTDTGGSRCKYDENEDSSFVVRTPLVSPVDGANLPDWVFFGVLDGVGGSKEGRRASVLMNDRITQYVSRGKVENFAKLKTQKTRIDEDSIDVEPVDLAVPDMKTSINRAFETANEAAFRRFGILEGSACAVMCGIDRAKREVVLANAGDTRGIVIVEKKDGSISIAGKSRIHNAAGEKIADKRTVGKEYLQLPATAKKFLTTSLGCNMDYDNDVDPDFVHLSFEEGDKVTVVLASDGGLGDRYTDYEVLQAYEFCQGNSQEMQNMIFQTGINRNGTKQFDVVLGPKNEDVYGFKNNGESDNVTITVAQVKF